MELSHLMTQIVFAYFLIFSVVLFDFKNRIGVWRELLPVSVSSFLQLLFIGFVILYLIKWNNPWLIPIVVLIMTVNAAFIASKRFQLSAYGRKEIFITAFGAIAVVNYLLLVSYILLKIINWNASQVIPFAGLLIAAGMRSISLFSQYIKDLILKGKDILEGMFALGAPAGVVKNYLLKKAIPLTTVVIRDMLKAAGIVHIPGVMVGLLLAGTHPLVAATMQFLVLSSMLFSMFFTPIVFYLILTNLKGVYLEKETP
jgi:putative ABC transport system permease protein